MNTRVLILIGAWAAMVYAFHSGDPGGYLIILVGLAASIAIAADDLREEDLTVSPRDSEVAATAAAKSPATAAPVRQRRTRVTRSKVRGFGKGVPGGLAITS